MNRCWTCRKINFFNRIAAESCKESFCLDGSYQAQLPPLWDIEILNQARATSSCLLDGTISIGKKRSVGPHSQWPCRVLSGVKGALSGERPFKKHRPDTFEQCAISAIWLSQLQSRSALPARFNQINSRNQFPTYLPSGDKDYQVDVPQDLPGRENQSLFPMRYPIYDVICWLILQVCFRFIY